MQARLAFFIMLKERMWGKCIRHTRRMKNWTPTVTLMVAIATCSLFFVAPISEGVHVRNTSIR